MADARGPVDEEANETTAGDARRGRAGPATGRRWRSGRRAAAALGVAALVLTGCGDDGDDDDVAADDPLTTDETVDRVSDFDTLDANGDSYLDADEIAERADAAPFEVWDADADSEIDRDEIADNAFSLWDDDGNGTVSEKEWETSSELWYPEGSGPGVIRDWDLDGDSELDADEFTESFDSSLLGESWAADSFDQETFETAYFELYDTDDDGRVTEGEWDEGLQTFGSPRE